MREKSRLVLLFAAIGFFASLAGTIFLWFYVGAYTPLVLGFHHPWLYCTFPFVGAASAACWALPFTPTQFGALSGALIGILTFATVCAYVSLLGFGFAGFLAYLMFGFILFGWLGVIVGAVSGHLYRGALNHRAR